MGATLLLLVLATVQAEDGSSIWDEEDVVRLDHEPGFLIGAGVSVESRYDLLDGLAPLGMQAVLRGQDRLDFASAWLAGRVDWTPQLNLPGWEDLGPRIWDLEARGSVTARQDEAGVFDFDVWVRGQSQVERVPSSFSWAYRSTAGLSGWLPLRLSPNAQLGAGAWLTGDSFDRGVAPWFTDPYAPIRSRLSYGAQGRATLIVAGRHAVTAAFGGHRFQWRDDNNRLPEVGGDLTPAPASGVTWRGTVGWGGPVVGRVVGILEVGYGQARTPIYYVEPMAGADGLIATGWLIWAPDADRQVHGGVHMGFETGAWTELRQTRCAAVQGEGRVYGPLSGALRAALLRDAYTGLYDYSVARLRTGLDLSVDVLERLSVVARVSWDRQVSVDAAPLPGAEYDALAAWGGVTWGSTSDVRPAGAPDLAPMPAACRDAWSEPVPTGTGGAWPYRTSDTPGAGERPRTRPIQFSGGE